LLTRSLSPEKPTEEELLLEQQQPPPLFTPTPKLSLQEDSEEFAEEEQSENAEMQTTRKPAELNTEQDVLQLKGNSEKPL